MSEYLAIVIWLSFNSSWYSSDVTEGEGGTSSLPALLLPETYFTAGYT